MKYGTVMVEYQRDLSSESFDPSTVQTEAARLVFLDTRCLGGGLYYQSCCDRQLYAMKVWFITENERKRKRKRKIIQGLKEVEAVNSAEAIQ